MATQLFIITMMDLGQVHVSHVVLLVDVETTIILASNSSARENKIITFPFRAPFKSFLHGIQMMLVALQSAADHVIHVNAQDSCHLIPGNLEKATWI